MWPLPALTTAFTVRSAPVPITSLGHKSNRTGKTAAAMVLELLAGKPPRSGCLEWELKIRDSG